MSVAATWSVTSVIKEQKLEIESFRVFKKMPKCKFYFNDQKAKLISPVVILTTALQGFFPSFLA